jgi:hypothetical protein
MPSDGISYGYDVSVHDTDSSSAMVDEVCKKVVRTWSSAPEAGPSSRLQPRRSEPFRVSTLAGVPSE